jgi:hypothetical protein
MAEDVRAALFGIGMDVRFLSDFGCIAARMGGGAALAIGGNKA